MSLQVDISTATRELLAAIREESVQDTMPMVLWLCAGETAEVFAGRCFDACNQRDLVLAAVPAGFPVPAGIVRKVELPEKHFWLLHPSNKRRYRVLRGGRGAAKSWSIARVLILRTLIAPERWLCAREFQRSIAESAHRLLSDQIELMGLSSFYTVMNQTITSHAGGEFIFDGVALNVSKIKSLEGLDGVWCEESAKISQNSWQVLIPTVRKPGSELWINFNAESENDPTYTRFVATPPPDADVLNVIWSDNPWFPAELERERQYLTMVDPDAAAHVWGGECLKHSAAAVFAGKYTVQAFEVGPDFKGPYYGADWGFSVDPTTLIRAWIHERSLYIDYEAYAVGCDIDRTPALFDDVPGARAHVIRADSARPETISYMQTHGYGKVTGVKKWPNSVEEGIRFLRQFEQILVHPRCTHVADEMRLYSFRVDKLTGDVMTDLVDKHNHTIDAVRYGLQPLIQQSQGGAGWVEWMNREVKRMQGHTDAHAQAEVAKPAEAPHPSQMFLSGPASRSGSKMLDRVGAAGLPTQDLFHG